MLGFIPKSWLPYVEIVITATALVLVALVFYALAARIIRLAIARKAIAPPVGAVLRSMLRWAFVIITVAVVLQAIGVLENLWAALAAVAALVAIGFVAVWSVMSNLLCALIILVSRPFRVGDEIGFVGESFKGKVIDFSPLFTTLRSGDGDLVQIPNNLFFQRTLARTQNAATTTLWEQLNSDRPTE